MGLFSLALMILLCFGLYPILSEPLFAPRAMYGVGCLLAYICVYIASSKRHLILKAFIVLLCWCFFSFSYTYGNALSVQDDYTEFRMQMVLQDINSLNIPMSQEDKVGVQVSGSIGFAPPVENLMRKYPILGRLVPVTFRETWYWGWFKLVNYYGFDMKHTDADLTEMNLPILKETTSHTIKGNEECLLIELK